MQRRVILGIDKGLGLVLGPEVAVDGDDGGLADQDAGGVAGFLVLEEGAAVEVGEVEGDVALEGAGRGEEGFALVECHVGPVAEVGFGDLAGAGEGLVMVWLGERGGDGKGDVQLLSPREMFVVVDEVIAALFQGPGVYA